MLNQLPLLVVVWPFTSAFIIALLAARRCAWVRFLAVAAMLLQLALSITGFLVVNSSGPMVFAAGGWAAPYGIEVELNMLASVVLVLIAGVGLAVSCYMVDAGRHDLPPAGERWFLVLAMVLTGSMSGLTVGKDLFNLFVMIEISSLAAYGIVSVRDHPSALEAAFKYLVLGAMGSGCILLATALVYATTGYLDIAMAHSQMQSALAAFPRASIAALALYLVGFGLKSGIMPLHTWLPDAHGSAATVSSALLSGLVVKANAIAFFRVAFGVWGASTLAKTPLPDILLILSIVSMIGGASLAWGQRDIKRLLAYSTVGHMGYIFLGVALGGVNALGGSLMHVFNHALLKSCLFMAAGLMVAKAGTRDIPSLEGIGRAMPITTGAFTIAALGMIGVPGTAGFISKWYIALGALDLGRAMPAMAILVSSLLNGVFYLPIVIEAYLRPGPYTRTEPEAPKAAMVAVCVLAGLVIFFGLWPTFPLRYLLEAAQALLGIT